MNRSEIITEVGRHVPYFTEKWDIFCRRMEEYAARFKDLAEQAQRQYDQYGRENAESIKTAIGEAKEQFGPAWEAVEAASKVCQKTEQILRARIQKITKGVNERWSNLSDAEKHSLTPNSKVRQIEAAQLRALKRCHDREMKHLKAYRDAKAKHDDIKARTRDSYYAYDVRKIEPDVPSTCVEWNIPGVYAFVNMPYRFSPFWLPNDLRNPALWFGLVPGWDMDLDQLTPEEQDMKAAVILTAIHCDHCRGKGAVERIYLPGDYPRDGHFLADDFLDTLAKRLQVPDADAEIETAWERISGELAAMTDQPRTQGDSLWSIREEAKALVDLPGARKVLCQGVSRAKAEHPDILERVKHRCWRAIKDLGYPEGGESKPVNAQQQKLLDCILAAIAFDSLVATGPDVARVAFDFHSDAQPGELDSLDENAIEIYHALTAGHDGTLQTRVRDAMRSVRVDLEKAMRELATPAAGAKGKHLDGSRGERTREEKAEATDLPHAGKPDQGADERKQPWDDAKPSEGTFTVVVDKSVRNYSRCDRLLQEVANDSQRSGVTCNQRTYRSLLSRLKTTGYDAVAPRLMFNSETGLLKTTLPAGALIVEIREKP